MSAFARPPTEEEMAKAHAGVKHSAMVAKSTPRDSQSEIDTALAVSSPEVAAMRRAAMESVTSETSTVDRHPVLGGLGGETTDPGADEDDERETDTKRAATAPPTTGGLQDNTETVTMKQRAPRPPVVAATSMTMDAPTHVELSADDLEPEEAPPGEASHSEVITERREADHRKSAPPPAAVVLPRQAARGKHLDDETMPMLVGDISGALETVPLSAALVANVLAQVDARAAAKPAQAPVEPPRVVVRPPVGAAPFVNPFAPRRRIGVEIAIAAFTFLVVALPALYFLYMHL